MSQYARINTSVTPNVGAELFTTTGNISEIFHSDLTWVDVDAWPGVVPGWVATVSNGVWSFAAPAAIVLSPAQLANGIMGAGLSVTCTSTPALTGTYPCDATTQNKLSNVALYVQANGKFPANLTEFPVFDISGTVHLFPTTAEFLAFVTKMGDFITELDLYAGGAVSSAPAQPITIP